MPRRAFPRGWLRRAAACLLAAALLPLLCSPAAAKSKRRRPPDPKKGAIISSITVETYEVFEATGTRLSRLLFHAANSVHSKTREAVVRRELLFAVGDRYDDALITETERNLRRLGFLRRAKITAALNARGMVDVKVRTYDSWSLEVQASFKRAGGVNSTRLGLAEHNLLGQGKSLSATYFRDGTSASQSFAWKDPQFLNKSHLEFETGFAVRSGSRRATLSLRRPFFASTARSALGFSSSFEDKEVSTFSEDGRETGTVRKKITEAGVEYGRALGISPERLRRLKGGLRFRRANYAHSATQAAGPRPSPEQAYFLDFGAEWTELDFIKVQQIQKFSHDEDFNLGFGIVPSVLWAPDGIRRPLGSQESQVLPKVVVRKGFGDGEDLLLLRGGYSSAYINPSTGNRTVSGDVIYYRRGLPRQTLAFHGSYDHGWRLDPSALLGLGESNGLRGYGLSQFQGDRRLLLNVEDRLFIRNEIFRLIDLGAVAFFDSGFVWPRRTQMDLRDLRHSIGIGLRLAPSRSASNQPIRVDLARALNPNGTSSRWSLSILAGHAFGE